MIEHGRRLARAATPFGFSATTWRSLRETAAELVDMIEADDTADDVLAELAQRLRDTLHRLV